MDIYEEIVRLKKDGRSSALATIIQCIGSSPQKQGAKMLVRDDGSILGTLGGGCLEAEVIQNAFMAVRDGTPRNTSFEILLQAHEQKPEKILIPHCNGRKGHPVLFPKEAIHAVFSGMNLREVMYANSQKVKLVHVMDEGVLFDMDTREDYKNILKRF